MGKNHRHKKDLKAEKAKVKLKQSKTKFLPKGLNVTNTSFKIKPIVLLEQLKQNRDEGVLSKRKLNAKDLLSRLKHYNEKVRLMACEELSDMIKLFSKEIVEQHLSEVCLAISSLMQDRESKVRRAAVKTIQAILYYVPADKLTPFLDFFSTNLRCAMTNIDKNVQEDSLLFLDCFIRTNSGLITKTSEKLLPDFLSLISKLRSDSQPGRTLTLNLGSKMTSVAWRIKVLSRLHAMLSVILNKSDKGGLESLGSSEKIFNASEYTTFPIYKESFARKLEEHSVNVFSATKTVHEESDTLNRHIITLIPLLYETWLEVIPEQKVQHSTSHQNSTLTEEMGALLTCITNTLYLLWRYVQKIENEDINLKTVFMSSEGQKFLAHLLNNFPYSHTGPRTKKSKNGLTTLELNKDPKYVRENLFICFLYLVLHVNYTQRNLKKDVVAINSYLTKIFFQNSSLNGEGVDCIIQLLSECFGVNSQKWHRRGVDLQVMLENSIVLNDRGKIGEAHKLKLFQILSNIFNNAHLNKNDVYQSWLATLPNLLCQPSVTDTAVSALLDLSRKNCTAFHQALVQALPDIAQNMSRLQIIQTCDSPLHSKDAVKRNLAAIFYYIPGYSKEDFQVFQDCIDKIGKNY